MRLIDRPLRPLFPEGFKDEVLIQAMVLSTDQQNDPDLLASSAGLSLTTCWGVVGKRGSDGGADGWAVELPRGTWNQPDVVLRNKPATGSARSRAIVRTRPGTVPRSHSWMVGWN